MKRRRLLQGLHVLSGWFLIYLAVGGLIGFYVAGPYTSEPSCTPFLSVFGVIESSCPNSIVNTFWSIVVGLPRLVLVFPSLAIALFKSAGWRGNHDHFWDASVWLLYSIPILLVIGAGNSYWQRRFPVVGTLAIVVIALQVFALGFAQ